MNGRLLKYLLKEASSLGANVIFQNLYNKVCNESFKELLQKMNDNSSNGIEIYKSFIELYKQVVNLKEVLQTELDKRKTTK